MEMATVAIGSETDTGPYHCRLTKCLKPPWSTFQQFFVDAEGLCHLLSDCGGTGL